MDASSTKTGTAAVPWAHRPARFKWIPDLGLQARPRRPRLPSNSLMSSFRSFPYLCYPVIGEMPACWLQCEPGRSEALPGPGSLLTWELSLSWELVRWRGEAGEGRTGAARDGLHKSSYPSRLQPHFSRASALRGISSGATTAGRSWARSICGQWRSAIYMLRAAQQPAQYTSAGRNQVLQ